MERTTRSRDRFLDRIQRVGPIPVPGRCRHQRFLPVHVCIQFRREPHDQHRGSRCRWRLTRDGALQRLQHVSHLRCIGLLQQCRPLGLPPRWQWRERRPECCNRDVHAQCRPRAVHAGVDLDLGRGIRCGAPPLEPDRLNRRGPEVIEARRLGAMGESRWVTSRAASAALPDPAQRMRFRSLPEETLLFVGRHFDAEATTVAELPGTNWDSVTFDLPVTARPLTHCGRWRRRYERQQC